MRIDLEQKKYLDVLNDPKKSQLEKYEFYCKMSREYLEIDKFQEFCKENFKNMDDKMIEFCNKRIDDIIRYAIHFSDFPRQEHEKMIGHYKNLMDTYFRPNAKEYLTTVIFKQ